MPQILLLCDTSTLLSRKSVLASSLLSSLLGSRGLRRSLLGSLGGFVDEPHLGVLVGDSLLLANGVLGSSGLSLSLEILLTDNFSLVLVDLLDENVLVLELVTLGGKVELMVHLAVDLLGLSISLEESTEDTETSHPDDLLGPRRSTARCTISSEPPF